MDSIKDIYSKKKKSNYILINKNNAFIVQSLIMQVVNFSLKRSSKRNVENSKFLEY